ncbi:hypothetical protein [Spiroplasma melliferum]|uniref:hypothetical protein n=1 Tax=Spiroplasma melliferum TaxID=2134 RepID=UPI000C756EDA|nr:hypothetical protein [Spiroplasma melliferum]
MSNSTSSKWKEIDELDNFTKLVFKFNFDKDFFYKVWNRYSELDYQKSFRIMCEKLQFFQNSHSFIQNFIFKSNLNFIINDNENFSFPDSMVTQFLDLQMGLNTLSFMPISPKIGILVINSVWSHKFTTNDWTGAETIFYTSLEKQTNLFKKIYIDSSEIEINNNTWKESELNWKPHNNDYWGNTLGVELKGKMLNLFIDDLKLIKYKFLTEVESEIFYLNNFSYAYANKFIIFPKK